MERSRRHRYCRRRYICLLLSSEINTSWQFHWWRECCRTSEMKK